jgi:hypothetical protein
MHEIRVETETEQGGTMTKKDYIAVAKILKDAREDAETAVNREARSQTDQIALMLSELFAQENPRFDRVRFLKACGQ